MAECPACNAEGYSPGVACAACGVRSVPELELDIPAPKVRAAKPARPSVEPIELSLSLELPDLHEAPAQVLVPVDRRDDDELQARSLADYGPAPAAWYGAPRYAYRVWKRQRELRAALLTRKEEAGLAKEAATDALVATGERARAAASKEPSYGTLLQELRAKEDLLRSRDHSLAKEQEAHTERIGAIDVRIARLEKELSEEKAEEHAILEELAQADAAKKRAEGKAKRAEIEIRNLKVKTSPRSPGASS